MITQKNTLDLLVRMKEGLYHFVKRSRQNAELLLFRLRRFRNDDFYYW